MSPERWQEVDRLLQSALQQPPDRRDAFLLQVCGEDAALEQEVRSLLAAQREAGSFLENGAMDAAAQALVSSEESDADRVEAPHELPGWVGRYRILRLLGEGGMGVVYEAEQERPRRIVALKLLRPGFASQELRRRFDRESWALGRLHHPGIAQIYEASVADSGPEPQPYFAMELIRGESLREYAEKRGLDMRQRMRLILQVCEAVHHAHLQGIIHRDLKPGNILVDEAGQPKILDFGVARATDCDAYATRQTDLGQLVGTLAYMSPEQVLGDPSELDVRSDVYALGVILYELLAKRLPYAISSRLPEAVQTIREEDPAPLSSVDRMCRGDVETIAAKALEKDKERRYGSAAELAADIRRYLQDEPILARPLSTAYQLKKFARRHTALVAGVAAVIVVLAAGIAVSAWQAARATAEKQRANSEAAIAKAVNEFLQNDLLAQAGPSAQSRPDTEPDPDLKVRTALDRAAVRIESRFARQPLVEASIRQTIGQTYEDLGLYPEAQGQLERAVGLRRQALGELHPDTLRAAESLGSVYQSEGKWAEAEGLYERILKAQSHLLGPEHPDTLGTMSDLGLVKRLQGKYAQAEALFTRVVDAQRRALGEENAATLQSTNNLGMVYRNEGKYAQAEPLFVRLLELEPRIIGQDHPLTLTTIGELGAVYRLQGKYAQAEPLCVRVLEARRRVSGKEHSETLIAMNNLGLVYLNEAKYEQAEPLFTSYIETERRTRGEEYHDTLTGMNNLASLYMREGKYAEAEALLRRVVDIRKRVSGAEHPYTLIGMNSLGVLYRYQGKYALAEALLTDVLTTRRRVLGVEHPDTLATLACIADVYQAEGRYAQAEPLFTQALAARRRVLTPDHPDTSRVMDSLSRLLLKEGRYKEAEALLREALSRQEQRSPDAWERYDTAAMLGASLAGQGKYREAETLLLAGYAGLVQRKSTIPFPNRFVMAAAREGVAQLYRSWGKPRKTAELRKRLNSPFNEF